MSHTIISKRAVLFSFILLSLFFVVSSNAYALKQCWCYDESNPDAWYLQGVPGSSPTCTRTYTCQTGYTPTSWCMDSDGTECNQFCGNGICERYGTEPEGCYNCPIDCQSEFGCSLPTCADACKDACPTGFVGSCSATQSALIAGPINTIECSLVSVSNFGFFNDYTTCSGSTPYCVCRRSIGDCVTNADCNDGKACTRDLCDFSGECTHPLLSNCCSSNSDCPLAPYPDSYVCCKPPATTGYCSGTVVGAVPDTYEGEDCSQFETQSSCMQGWPTHGCHWNYGTTTAKGNCTLSACSGLPHYACDTIGVNGDVYQYSYLNVQGPKLYECSLFGLGCVGSCNDAADCECGSCAAGYYNRNSNWADGCECAGHATSSCYLNNIWWFDSCGYNESIRTNCNGLGCSGQTCYTCDCSAAQTGTCGTGGYIGYKCNGCTYTSVSSTTETCNNADDNCNGVTDEGCDDDNDNYCDSSMSISGTPTTCSAGGGDCNDGSSAVRPGLSETCNNVDDNCASGADEGCDDDNDNYCDSSMTLTSATTCSAGGGDCNDGSSAVRPGLSETCNNVDDNCASGIDNGCDDDSDFYADSSMTCSGSFRDGTGVVRTCASYSGDCNDGSSAVRPGLSESCNNVDDNCASGIDENCDNDNDFYADSSMTCSGSFRDGTAVVRTCSSYSGDCVDTNSAINPGRAELCDGFDNNCVSGTDEGCSCTNGATQPCGTDVGECVAGTSTCSGGTWGSCVGAVTSISERCDNLDNDCNGVTDNSCDDDSDHYADSSLTCSGSFRDGTGTLRACTTNNGDCNDNMASIHPGLAESCNNVDDNCVSGADEGCDNDNDFYADSSMTCSGSFRDGTAVVRTCASYSGDCNDNNGLINPGRAELCDGFDNNCLNGIDEGCGCINGATQSEACTNGTGQCVRSGTRTLTCSGGVWDNPACPAVPGAPAAEACDGDDDNCNGINDDGAPNSSQICVISHGRGNQTLVCSSASMIPSGICIRNYCDPGYTFGPSNDCIQLTCSGAGLENCTLPNGTGNRSMMCNTTTGSWQTDLSSPCILDHCNIGYIESAGTCILDKPPCGDNILNTSFEACDDGIFNNIPCIPAYGGNNCTYCDGSCNVQIVYAPYCGDSAVNGIEQCDDGNTIDTDACRNDCTLPTAICTSCVPYYNRTGFLGGESPSFIVARTGTITTVYSSTGTNNVEASPVSTASEYSSPTPIPIEKPMAIFNNSINGNNYMISYTQPVVTVSSVPTKICMNSVTTLNRYCQERGYQGAITNIRPVGEEIGGDQIQPCANWSGTSWYRSYGPTYKVSTTLTCSYFPVCAGTYDYMNANQYCQESGYDRGSIYRSDNNNVQCMKWNSSSPANNKWLLTNGSTGSVNCYYNLGYGSSGNLAFELGGEVQTYNCSRDGVCVEDFAITPICGPTETNSSGIYYDPDCGTHTWQNCGRFQLRNGAIGYDCNPIDNRSYNAHTQCVNPTDCVYYNSTNNAYQCIPNGGMLPVPGQSNAYIICRAGVMFNGTTVNSFCPEEYQWNTGQLASVAGSCVYPANRCASVCPQAYNYSSSNEFGTLCNDRFWTLSGLEGCHTGDNCPSTTQCNTFKRSYVTNTRCFVNSTHNKFEYYCGPIISYPEYQYHSILEIRTN